MVNPTIKTQEKILEIVKNTFSPMSFSSIARESKKGFGEVKMSIEFFQKLGIVELIVSNEKITLVKYIGKSNGN